MKARTRNSSFWEIEATRCSCKNNRAFPKVILLLPNNSKTVNLFSRQTLFNIKERPASLIYAKKRKKKIKKPNGKVHQQVQLILKKNSQTSRMI
jgi:hypothetical protein